MAVGIIELNDCDIRIGVDGQIRAASAGIAVIRDDKLLLGEQAMQLSRLHPADTNSTFWHRLSVEPLNKHYPNLRHHADLAYQQLLNLHQQCSELKEIVFAIPGSFTRDQLSLLLGIVEECPFNAVGLIDSAVAASADMNYQIQAGDPSIVHLDMQLHQCLLTSLSFGHSNQQSDTEQKEPTPSDSTQQKAIRQNFIRRELVNMVPDTGQLALYNKSAQFIADQFVTQARFDPLHSATTEQQLYNQIPAWLQLCEEQEELVLVVGNKTIKLARDQLITTLTPIYQTILQQIKQLFPDSNRLLVSNRFSAFPGCLDSFESHCQLTLLPDTSVINNINQNLANIVSTEGGIGFLQSLPLLDSSPAQHTPANTETPKPSFKQRNDGSQHCTPTHILLQHTAYKIDASAIYIAGQQSLFVSSEKTEQARFKLQGNGKELSLSPLTAGVRVNHFPVNGNMKLTVGDTIQLDGIADPITIISEVIC